MTWKAYAQVLKKDCSVPCEQINPLEGSRINPQLDAELDSYDLCDVSGIDGNETAMTRCGCCLQHGQETVACLGCIPRDHADWIQADEDQHHWRCRRCRCHSGSFSSIHSFFLSSVCPSIHSSVHSSIRPSIHPCIQSFVIHSIIHTNIRTCIYSSFVPRRVLHAFRLHELVTLRMDHQACSAFSVLLSTHRPLRFSDTCTGQKMRGRCKGWYLRTLALLGQGSLLPLPPYPPSAVQGLTVLC